MSSQKAFQLVHYLDVCICNSPIGLPQLLLERDLLLILLMWEIPLRGNHIGKVSLEDSSQQWGSPSWGPGLLQLPPISPPMGSALCF